MKNLFKKQDMTNEFFLKYINNNCSREEIKSVISWFADMKNEDARKLLLEDMWNNEKTKEFDSKADFSFILDKIHHDINIEVSKKETRESQKK